MIQPLLDRVLLEKVEEEKKTESGIILAETPKELPSTGRVIAVGPGKRDDAGALIPVDVEVGDVVIYKQYSSTEVKDNQKTYLIVENKDILAIVR